MAAAGATETFSIAVGPERLQGKSLKGGGNFTKFGLAATHGSGLPIAAAGGTLTLTADLKSGSFSAKDAASQSDISGSFSCP